MLRQVDDVVLTAPDGVKLIASCIRVDVEGMIQISDEDKMATYQHARNGTSLKKVRGVAGIDLPHGSDDYYHSRTIAEIQKIMREGDKESKDVEEVLKLSRELTDPQPVDTRRVLRFADEGDELDSDRYLAQDWDNMFRTTKAKYKRTGNKVLDLTFRWGGNANRSRREMFTTGAVCIALVNKLEELGYSVGVRGVFASRCWGSRNLGWVECHMKHPGEPLNVEMLTTMACHPGVFRWYGVNCNYWTQMDIGGDAGSALYGEQVDWLGAELTKTGLIAEPDVALPEFYDKKRAREFVEKFIAEMAAAEEDFFDE